MKYSGTSILLNFLFLRTMKFIVNIVEILLNKFSFVPHATVI